MKLVVILILAVFAIGCETIRGVTRVAYFEPVPANECVITSAKSIEGLTEIEYVTESGGRPLTLHGIEKTNVIHRYWYTYKGIENDFYFVESYNGEVEFRHGYGCLNCYPPQEAIDTIYPFIIEMENRLQEQCGVSSLASGVQEFCSGVKCPNA
ncbi:hypothetical protein ACJJIG_17615 [Microbulbifer sp. SSSA007]|uniref:hypothetical protein n=1 Tax=Microbulbifer sp. SSSA007 TaxID=3243379 RepID=UPI0040395EC2